MSRRRKLIIAALFLVLLAIPVTYIAFTWSPPMPLRVRLIEVRWKPEDETARKPKGGAHTWLSVCVAVENTSSHPVHLRDAKVIAPDIFRRDVEHLGDITSMEPDPVGLPRKEGLVFPPHRTVPAWGVIRSDVLDRARNGRLHLECHWVSGTKRRAQSICTWLFHHSPSWLQAHVPYFDMEEDDVPIDAMVEK